MFFLPFTRKPYPKFFQILEAAKKTPVPETLFDKVIKKVSLAQMFSCEF